MLGEKTLNCHCCVRMVLGLCTMVVLTMLPALSTWEVLNNTDYVDNIASSACPRCKPGTV